MEKKLDRFFLEALVHEFPFLKGWKPTFNSASRPVTFRVKRELPVDTVWNLELGRHNNESDPAFTRGVTGVGLSNGESFKWIGFFEGETRVADVLNKDTVFVIEKYEYRSQLVYDDPGCVKYTLYKRAPVCEIEEESVCAAKLIAAELK